MKTIETGSFVIEVNSEVREYKRDIEWRKNLYFVCVLSPGKIVYSRLS